MPADSANADIQLARLIVQKRLATPDQVKQAMMAAVAHPQKPGLLKMMVSRKLITPDQAKQLQAALGGGGATSSAAAKPAQKKKPAGGLEFADDDEDALPTGPTAAQMLGGRLLVDDVGLADADDDDELEIPDDIGDLEIPDDALPASSGSGGGKKKRKKKKPVAADDDIAVMKAPPGPTLDCINCRHKNPPKSRSCNRCGAPLDPSKLKGRPEELGVQRFAWVKPLLGLLAIGGIVYALYANGLIGGGGSSNSNAPRNMGGGDKARNVATNTPTTAADELVAAAPGVRNGEMIRVRGVLQSQRSYQLTILTPHGTEVTINHRGRPTGWLGEYATKPERFADKPLEFVGELFWRPGNTPVVNKATLSAEGFWIDDGSGFDFLLDADAPEPKVEGGPGASADPSDPADPGDPADPLDPADPSTPGIPDLPPPSEYLQGLWADVLAIGPQSEADTKDADRVKKWNTMTRQLRRMSEVAYIPLALDWLDANPAPAIDQSSKYVPAVDGELWGAVLKGVAMHRGRRPWGERIGKAMEAAMPRYPQWVAESIGQATLDPMAVTRVALWAAEPDDGVSSEMLKARNAARNAVMTQLTQLRDRDVVIPLMRKLAN
ncbi:MAG: zinc ribbon domain-containing protein, partial [Planctomycetota bacterium]